MRTQIVALGVVIASCFGQNAAAQRSFGAVPAPGGSFPTASPTAPQAPTPPAGPAMVPQVSSPGGSPTAVLNDPRPRLGNAPAPPLATRGPVDLYRATPDTYQRIVPPRKHPYFQAGGYAVVPYYDVSGDRDPSQDHTRRAPAPRPGYVVFRIHPATSEVYVDGYYIGTVADLAAGRALPEGAYRLEIRAPGFDTVTTDVRILAGETITINRQLTRTPAPAPPAVAHAAPPAPAKPFYVIRGCYAGSTHPKDVKLPAGCDVRNVRVVPPIVSEVGRPRS